MAIFYVFFLLPVIITCFINIYWLFPWQRRNAYPFRKISGKLLIAPAILSLVCWIIFGMASGKDAPAFPLAVFAVLLLIATPVSWLLYISQRGRLDEMLNLQKSLGKTAADLQFLRSQINPHFLFNALNTIYGTALQENAERTAEGVQKLGDMMRFMLHENQEDRISLQKEINYLTNYIELQKLRTQVSKDIDISFTVKQENCEHTIAPMLLIPFVENAFKHGISLRERSWIKINISCDTEHVYFDVYNSVHPRREDDPEKDRPGIGLDNVKQRLSLLYPQQHELQIRSTATEYFIHLTIKP
jgi:LytS/YehU family sensor histidine kinase